MAKVVRMTHWSVKDQWHTEYFDTVAEATTAAEGLPPSAKAYVVEIVSREEAPQGIKIIRVNSKTAPLIERTRAELTEVYNDVVPSTLLGFRDHPTAVRRTEQALSAAFPEEMVELEDVNGDDFDERGTDVSSVEVVQEVKRRGRASAFAQEAKIVIVTDTNPKRAGTEAFDRFALYRDGMTVKDYLDAGGRLSDLKWDRDHNFIQVR